MKTITITVDDKLERKLTDLSLSAGLDIADVTTQVLSVGLSEKDRRTKALQALDTVFSQEAPSPFNQLSESEVEEMVDKEIRAVRQQ